MEMEKKLNEVSLKELIVLNFLKVRKPLVRTIHVQSLYALIANQTHGRSTRQQLGCSFSPPLERGPVSMQIFLHLMKV